MISVATPSGLKWKDLYSSVKLNLTQVEGGNELCLGHLGGGGVIHE
jgi:hypothetical protein